MSRGARGGATAELTPGVPRTLSPLVRRVVAPNPGPMTGPGTNTYLVGEDEVAVIDPGPEEPRHLDAIAECGGRRIRWILVTHTHADHAPGAGALRARLGPRVTVLGFSAGHGFDPDAEIGEGFVVQGGSFRLRAVHTPGHASDHLCYLLEEEELLFSGDHVMNGSTVVITPPDGDMSAYLSSLHRLRGLAPAAIAPGHGSLITDPVAKIDEYLAHRRAREEAVVAALAAAGRATVDDLLPAVYLDVDPSLHPVARYSLWAHLRKLAGEGRATADDPDDVTSAWKAVAAP
jgi:glyoxylase-like metal-dependent hydrolase (beta-lactamase superfamily II)